MPDGDEPDASGMSSLSRSQKRTVNRVLGSGLDLKLPEISAAAGAIDKLSVALERLKKSLSFPANTGGELKKSLDAIATSATKANAAVAGVGGSSAGSGGSSTAWVQQASQQASSASGSSAGSWAQRMPAGIKDASRYFTGFENPAVGAAMGGLRFLRERLGTNRNTAIAAGSMYGQVARQQGVKVEDIMKGVSQFPGDVYGTPEDMLGLFGNAPMYGASYNFGGERGGQGVRAAGMLKGISQAQMLSPGESVSQIMGNIGGFAANTKAQQQSAYLTGGAYSMIAAGGRQKSLSEWAESILQWLKGLRAGDMRNKDFTYGELMAQYFPGSNIDAWFEANGVPPNMRSYWWTYVLEKASKSPGKTTIGGEMQIRADESNVAWNRMRATSELTRTEFNLGAQMSGAYNQRERSNKWLNQLMGTLQTNMAPAFTLLAALPDTIEDILMGLLESFMGSKFGSSGPPNVGAVEPTGDVGDMSGIGDTGMYGTTGGTGLAGLSPNMRSKLGPMLAANPKLKVTSGLRDNAMQRRLKDKGYSRVSGKPSAHTRGDAADLGPVSEYGWIMQNAKKFGLKSGKNQGEPWHVGVGDIPSGYDLFSQIMSGAGSAGGMMDIIGSVLSSIFGGLGGVLGGGGGTEKPSVDWFNEMMPKGSEGFGSKLSGLSGLMGAGAAGGVGAGGGGGSAGSGATSGSRRDLGIQAAKAAYAAGFRGEELVTAVAISGRESNWNPNAYNGNAMTQDASYGLMQINMLGSLGPARRKAYGLQSNNELLDPYTNMRVAHEMYDDRAGQPFYPWGPYKGKPATYSTNVPEARDIVQTAFPSGYGDVETEYMMSAPQMRTSGNVLHFNNSFVIQAGGPSAQNGIDIRRTVTIMADQLEDEMNKRLSRTN